MNLHTINFTKIIDNYIKLDAAKDHKSAINTLPPELASLDTLSQITTVLGNIPIIRDSRGKISATAIANRLHDEPTTMYNGFSGEELRGLLRLTYYIPRSFFIKPTITKNPKLGSLTPLPLFAVRRDRGIKYEEWDKKDPKLKFFLGKQLEGILDYDNAREYDIKAIRDYLLTSSKDVRSSNTSYPHNSKKQLEGLNRVCLLILGQVWIANVELRTDSMILDLNNWDLMPPALDAIFSEERDI